MCKDWKGGGAPGASPFKAVIFDMDGVLVDTEVYYLDCRGQFLTESGVEVSHEELLELVGASVKQDRANMLKWFTRSGISIDADGIEMLEGAWWQGRDIDYATLLNPGVKETLIELKRRGVRLALASSSSHRNIAQVLADCGLGGFFEVITRANRTPRSTCTRWRAWACPRAIAVAWRIRFPASRPAGPPASRSSPNARSASASPKMPLTRSSIRFPTFWICRLLLVGGCHPVVFRTFWPSSEIYMTCCR